jgi:hypothetical protein
MFRYSIIAVLLFSSSCAKYIGHDVDCYDVVQNPKRYSKNGSCSSQGIVIIDGVSYYIESADNSNLSFRISDIKFRMENDLTEFEGYTVSVSGDYSLMSGGVVILYKINDYSINGSSR